MRKVVRLTVLLTTSVILQLGAVALSYSFSHLPKESWTTTPKGLEYTPVTIYSPELFWGILLVTSLAIWGLAVVMIRRQRG